MIKDVKEALGLSNGQAFRYVKECGTEDLWTIYNYSILKSPYWQLRKFILKGAHTKGKGKGRRLSEEHRKHLSETRKTNNIYNAWVRYNEHLLKVAGNKEPPWLKACKSKKRYIYDNISFDSKDELNFYKYCKAVGYDIKRGPALEFNFNGVKHHYLVDFEVNGCLIEIKGDHLMDKDGSWKYPYKVTEMKQKLAKAKYQCARDNNVIVIPSSKCTVFELGAGNNE